MKKQPKPVMAWAWVDKDNDIVMADHRRWRIVDEIRFLGLEKGSRIVRVRIVPVKPKRRAKR